MTEVVVAPATLRDATAEEIRAAVEDAHLPSLLAALAYATGDLSILRPELAPSNVSLTLAMDPSGGLSPQAQTEARRVATEVLLAHPDISPDDSPVHTLDDLRAIMEFITGPVDAAYLPLMIHELNLPADVKQDTWTKETVAPDRDFSVIIIGAGMSGLAAAYRLQEAGIPYTILERHNDVGGVWLENGYPGAKLDTSNFTYSYSFAQHGGWENQYSSRDEVLGYLRGVAERFDLRRNVQFGSTVVAGRFDDATGTWSLDVAAPDGSLRTLSCNAVISAVGQLNEPNIPHFEGFEDYAGPTWHTARWNADVDLHGKRVAVVGTGASAFQVIPKVAEQAAHVTVFQRTPAWVIPTPDYNAPLRHGLRWLLDVVPHYHRWYRFNQFWVNVDGIRRLALVDPTWEHPVSISPRNDEMRASLTEFLERSFVDRPDLLRQLVPTYPPYAKRTVRDDGTWTSALLRPNVSLTSDPIERFVPEGIVTADGTVHEVDAVVLGTGFRAQDFLATVELHGRDGVTLDELWQGDARAYYGITIPRFPNLFCLYGPNTNLNVNGSLVQFSEAAVDYTLESLRLLLETGARSMEVRDEPYREYNDRIDAASKTLAVGVSTVNSWYKNRFGRNSQNWPLTTLEYWQDTRTPRPDDYELR